MIKLRKVDNPEKFERFYLYDPHTKQYYNKYSFYASPQDSSPYYSLRGARSARTKFFNNVKRDTNNGWYNPFKDVTELRIVKIVIDEYYEEVFE